jgi:hypothetical protein
MIGKDNYSEADYINLVEENDRHYLKFLQNELNFVEARNRRIAMLTVRDIIL